MKMTFEYRNWRSPRVLCGGDGVVFIPRHCLEPSPDHHRPPLQIWKQGRREIFYSNGCNYCHTQYVRDVDAAWDQSPREAITF